MLQVCVWVWSQIKCHKLEYIVDSMEMNNSVRNINIVIPCGTFRPMCTNFFFLPAHSTRSNHIKHKLFGNFGLEGAPLKMYSVHGTSSIQKWQSLCWRLTQQFNIPLSGLLLCESDQSTKSLLTTQQDNHFTRELYNIDFQFTSQILEWCDSGAGFSVSKCIPIRNSTHRQVEWKSHNDEARTRCCQNHHHKV